MKIPSDSARRSGFFKSRTTLVAFSVLVAGALPGHADALQWANAEGGLFQTGTNWTGNVAPGSGDEAWFTLDDDYDVSFSGNVGNQALVVNHGGVNFDLGGSTYTLTNTGTNFSLSTTGTGSLTFTNGTIAATASSIAGASGTQGTLTLGSGAIFTGTSIVLGGPGSGIMNLQAGGSATFSSTVHIGTGTAASSLTVSGAGAQFTTTSTFRVGLENNGETQHSVLVSNGGKVSTGATQIGHNKAGSNGKVTVTGQNSSWTASSLYVGQIGKGELEVTNGATVQSSWSFIGSDVGSSGKVRVDGTGSAWTNTSGLYVGGFNTSTTGKGAAVLEVSNGGVVSASNAGLHNYSTGTITGNGTLVVNTLNNRGVINPGLATATTGTTLTITGNLVSNDTPTLNFRIFDDGTNDRLAISGNLGLGGTLNLDFTDYAWLGGEDTFQLFTWGGNLTGTFAAVTITGWNPAYVDLADLYTTGSITVIPEPGLAWLLPLGLGVVLVARRRKTTAAGRH
ncbi:MAG TPA: hypothetical protein VNQ90_14820 [Chthoniobacteraceae bacterium]|nr:hypothetical protein [Chthoniobacteraceae bacterium]